MTHINNLPPEVLIAILMPLCEEEHYRNSYWVSRLNVLAVCHRWRHLAQPMVYRKISIDYVDKLRTNMDLVTNKMIHYPRALNIWVNCKGKNPVHRLQDVLDKLQMNKGMLSRVSYLYIHVSISLSVTDSFKESLQGLAKGIKMLLPHISTLYSHINTFVEDGRELETALIKQYAPQLEKVEVNALALNKEVEFTKSLSSLRIWWQSGAGILPNIDVTCLTKLDLSGVDESFSWRAFASNSTIDDNVLCFPALDYIYVDVHLGSGNVGYENDYNYDDMPLIGPRNQFGYVLEAPRLRLLQIRLCPFTCSLLAAISAPKVLDRLEITCSNDTEYIFYGFSMTAASKRVFETYYKMGRVNGIIPHIGFINDLQSIHKLVQHGMHVSICHDFSVSEVESIYWPYVTILCIDSAISLTEVLMLVESKLPELVSLKVHSIKLGTLADGTLVLPELQDIPSLSSISCKIKTLEYGFAADDGSFQELCEKFNKFIFSVIKSLTSVGFVR